MSFMDIDGAKPAPRSMEKDPSQAVAAGVFQMNTSVNSLKRLIHTLGTPKDTPELREKLRKTRQQISDLAKDVSAKMKLVSEQDQGEAVSTSKRLGDAKLAKDFQAVLSEFQKAQRQAAEREASYAPYKPAAVELRSSGDSAQRPLLASQQRQELVQLGNEVQFNEAVIEERDQGIREIQGQISEVNEIFKDLAVLVHDQGHMIDDLEANIENANSSVVSGNRQLGRAAKMQKTTNTMTCYIVSFLAFAVFLLVLIMLI